MQKLPQILIAVVVATIAVFALQALFASDETRILWQIEEGIESFNARRSGSIVDILAENYRDVDSHVNRADAHRLLAHLFFTQVDPETKKFNYQLRVDLDTFKITDHDENTYRTVTSGILHRVNDASKDWDFEVQLWWREVEGDWLVFRSQFTSNSGRRPFR